MPVARGTISSRMVARVVALCRVRGHDGDALLMRAGVDPQVIADPEGRVLYQTAMRVGLEALALTGDPNFGLHLARDVQDSANFDAGVLVLMASPTVGAALERMARYQRYWGDGERAKLRPIASGVAIRYRLEGAKGAYARHSDECAIAEVVLGLRVMTGASISPRRVRFRHPAPADLREHHALFGCPIEFGAEHTELVLDDATLALPMSNANEIFCAIFEGQVERALARLPAASSASSSVRTAAKSALAAGHCTLARTAKALGTSRRNLQRQLQSEGTSFAAIVEALRRELATAYLSRGLPIPEVASMLGYADATAFHHAFRRWTGASPARWSRDCERAPES